LSAELEQQDDDALVRLAVRGRTEAFEALVQRHQDRLYGLLHRMVGDRERALDLAQETFLKAWRGLAGFQGQSAFYTWLYRIARNVVISAGRYDAARPHIGISLDAPDDDGEVSRITAGAADDGPSERALAAERRELVLRAIGSLPGEFREIIILRDMQDHAYEEIAEQLEIPVGTVRSRLHRARSELRARLEGILNPADRG
jgi:RNA polymerase sigma-70 factor (ECF subfamily)